MQNVSNPNPSFDILKLIFGNSLENIHSWFSSFLKSMEFFLINFFAKFVVFSAFFSSVMVILAVIYVFKYHEKKDELINNAMPVGIKEGKDLEVEMVNPKWKLVEDHINSTDESKWKLAIIESDIILQDLLDGLNLPGESIGEKLKAVETRDFKTIEQAWEAHKIRNAIAHEGSDFMLNQREAKRVIGLYEKVFDEFDIV